MRVEWMLAALIGCRFGTLDVQIHDHGILSASYNHCFTRYVGAGVDFLMRDVGRNVNEIASAGFSAEFQAVAPTHTRTASNDVDHRLQFAMMVGAGFGVRLDDYGTGP